jgi:hypothetical protein
LLAEAELGTFLVWFAEWSVVAASSCAKITVTTIEGIPGCVEHTGFAVSLSMFETALSISSAMNAQASSLGSSSG